MDTNNYVIIGGSTKCGTTSVFNYFEFHPQICPCIMKESRYFWDNDYPLLAADRDNKEYGSFSELFHKCKKGQWRMEATPDYLHSHDVPARIKGELKNVKFIFILRHPVDRVKSWYKFSSLNGLLPAGTTFKEYVYQMQNMFGPNAPQHMRALEQGRYYGYLKYYLDTFGKDKIKIMFYEELASDPQKFCGDICDFLDIDTSYFKNYNFRIFNKSKITKSVALHQKFRALKRAVRPFTRKFPEPIRKRLKLAGYGIERAYSSINQQEQISYIPVDVAMTNYFTQYFTEDIAKISNEIGRKVPWIIY